MKFGNLRSGSVPRVRAGSMRGFMKPPVATVDESPKEPVRMGPKLIRHTGTLFDSEALGAVYIEQYMNEDDDAIFELVSMTAFGSLRINLFKIDHHLNMYYYDRLNTVYIGKLGGHYNKACDETGVYFTSSMFELTEDEQNAISAAFVKVKNFYDIEHILVQAIVNNYKRFTAHEALIASVLSQVPTKENHAL